MKDDGFAEQTNNSRLFNAVAALWAATMGVLVLCGWQFDIKILKGDGVRFVAMNPLTAIGFILVGTGLFCMAARRPFATRIARIFPTVVIVISAIKLMSFIGPDLGIDRLFYTAKLEGTVTSLPNRMAPNTALSFFLMGLSLFFAQKRPWLSHGLALLTLLIAFLALLGYVYKIPPLSQISYFIPMALNTAVTFAVCCVGVLSVRHRQGLTGLLTNNDFGGALLRRALPALVLMPTALGWVAITGEQWGYYSSGYGIALVVIGGVLMTSTVLFFNAWSLANASRKILELNGQLRMTLQKLEYLNQELESFSYTVSHDLRAPLRSIIGFSGAVLESDGDHLSSQGKESFHCVMDAAKRMESLIDGLLTLAKATRGDLWSKTFSLTEIGLRVAAQLEQNFPSRRVEFVIQPEMFAHGDERLIENVILNLFGNALKFTARKEVARIELGITEKNGQQVFYVRDNGAGFDMKFAKKLFGVFQRLHSASEFEGTGIGLATVQRIVHRHGGVIWAEAAVNQGATFYFTLVGDQEREVELPTILQESAG